MANLTRSQAYDKLTHYAENNEYARDDLLAIRELLEPPKDVKVEMLLCELIAVAEISGLPGYVYDVCAKSICYIERLAAGCTEKLDEQN